MRICRISNTGRGWEVDIGESSKATTWWCHQMETFSRYWPFLQGFPRSSVNSTHKGQWRGVWYFFWCAPEWMVELTFTRLVTDTPSRPLWRHSNDTQTQFTWYIYDSLLTIKFIYDVAVKQMGGSLSYAWYTVEEPQVNKRHLDYFGVWVPKNKFSTLKTWRWCLCMMAIRRP